MNHGGVFRLAEARVSAAATDGHALPVCVLTRS
jgi:hypothetical protein